MEQLILIDHLRGAPLVKVVRSVNFVGPYIVGSYESDVHDRFVKASGNPQQYWHHDGWAYGDGGSVFAATPETECGSEADE